MGIPTPWCRIFQIFVLFLTLVSTLTLLNIYRADFAVDVSPWTLEELEDEDNDEEEEEDEESDNVENKDEYPPPEKKVKFNI